MIQHVYPEKLIQILETNPQYIPRKILPNEHLKLYRRYYITDREESFKVQQEYQVDGRDYYTIKYIPDNLFGEISFPLNSDSTYELYTDKSDLCKIPSIINTKISYSGAEIRKWFFEHKSETSSPRFDGFWAFLNLNSLCSISDNKYYFLYAIDCDDGIYRKCKVSTDYSKSEPKRKRR